MNFQKEIKKIHKELKKQQHLVAIKQVQKNDDKGVNISNNNSNIIQERIFTIFYKCRI